MRLPLHYVPQEVEEAVEEIFNSLSEEDRALFFSKGGEVSHVSAILGREIRDAWGPWDNDSPLVRHYISRGRLVFSPEFVIHYLLEEVWEKLCQERREAL